MGTGTGTGMRLHDARRVGPAKMPAWRGETYYDMPPVKPVPWDWKVATYVFLGGMAGAAQVLGLLADRHGESEPPPVTRRARALAVAGTVAGASLIIADLKTPRRFYNMLRIVRPTSGMSIGSWLLAGFGAFSGSALAAQMMGRPKVARAAQVPAAVAGAGMATYTGALFAATSTPRWATSAPLMGARFGLAGMAAGAAALSLGERDPATRRALDVVAMVASGAEAVLTLAQDRERHAKGIARDAPLTRRTDLAATALFVLPVALYAANSLRERPSPALSVAAATAVLAGSWLSRMGEMRGGRESAMRARDTFRFAQPPSPGDGIAP